MFIHIYVVSSARGNLRGRSIATSRTAVTAIAVTQIQLAFIFSHSFHGLFVRNLCFSFGRRRGKCRGFRRGRESRGFGIGFAPPRSPVACAPSIARRSFPPLLF